MVIWYAASAVVITFVVFRTPAIDYRLVALGAVIPVIEAPVGGGPLHALVTPTLVLVVIMALTRHRRLLRRQWLGLPIGMYLHLVVDAVANVPEVFWWPFLGWSSGSAATPEVGRGWWSVVLEVTGLLMALWVYRRFGLDDARRREVFLRTGQFDRGIAGHEAPGC